MSPRLERAWFRFAALPEGEFLLRAFGGAEAREHPVQVVPGGPGPQTLEFP